MNPKVFVGAAIAAIAVAIIFVVTSGSVLLGDGLTPGQAGQSSGAITPVEVNVDAINVLELDRNGATLEIVLTLTNPNPKSVILSLVKYQVFEDGERVAAGQIGSRSEGMVDASNYYTILSDGSIILRDKIVLNNAGGAPEFWAALEAGQSSWVVTGEAFFNLSSMTAGQENEISFEQVLG